MRSLPSVLGEPADGAAAEVRVEGKDDLRVPVVFEVSCKAGAQSLQPWSAV